MFMLPIFFLSIENDDDREFMCNLYIQYHMVMYRMAKSLTSSQADADDVVSDTCVALIKKIYELKQFDRGTLEGYIVSTVKNAAYAIYRKHKTHKEIPHDDEVLDGIQTSEPTPEDVILQRCNIDMMVAVIKKLNDVDQHLIQMKYFQKLSDQEIAGILGIREASVRVRLTRVRQRMLKWMEVLENE